MGGLSLKVATWWWLQQWLDWDVMLPGGLLEVRTTGSPRFLMLAAAFVGTYHPIQPVLCFPDFNLVYILVLFTYSFYIF